MDHEHLARRGRERLADAVQDAAADGDVVARVAAHGDGRRVGHACSSADCAVCAHATISATTPASGPERRVEGRRRRPPRRGRAARRRSAATARSGRRRPAADGRCRGCDRRRCAGRPSAGRRGARARSARVSGSRTAPPPRATTPPCRERLARPLRARSRGSALRRSARTARDRAVLAHDDLVGVGEGLPERAGDAASDARLARAHRPDQDDRATGRGHAR